MDIFKDQDFIPLRTFMRFSSELFGREIKYEELANLILNKFLNLYILISGNQEVIFLNRKTIENNPYFGLGDEINEYKLITYESEEIVNKELIENKIQTVENNFGSISVEILEKGKIAKNVSYNPFYFEEKVMRISNKFNFNGLFLLHFNFDELFEIDNKEALNTLKSLIYYFLYNLLKGISNNYLKEYLDLLERFFYIYLQIEDLSIYIKKDFLFKSGFDFTDNLYLCKKEIQDLIQQSKKTSIFLKDYNASKQIQREIINLKNKLAYDGNPTEINSLKSIIFGLLHILDPSRPIDRRYLTKAGRLNISKLSRDIDEFLKNVSLEEIKKVSNRTIRNHFSNIIKSKAS